MLKIITNMLDLDFGQLMAVYEEGNLENGADAYPHLSRSEQILRAEQDFYQYLRESFFPTPGAVYAVWENEGEYLSCLRLEPYQDGLLLEALETKPCERRKGYATMLMSAVCERFQGQKIYSHIHKKNTASKIVHASCGFQKVLDYAVFINGSVYHNYCTMMRQT